VLLAGREDKLYRVAKAVNASVDLCGSSSSALADGVLLIPPFPPALCW